MRVLVHATVERGRLVVAVGASTERGRADGERVVVDFVVASDGVESVVQVAIGRGAWAVVVVMMVAHGVGVGSMPIVMPIGLER